MCDLVWTAGLCAAITIRSSPRPRLGDLHRTVQIQVSRLQSVDCDSLCLFFDVQFEGLATMLNYIVVTIIGLLKWSPVGITRNKNKLGLLEVGW